MPKVATIAVAIVAAVVLTVVLTRPDGSAKAGGEVFLQAAGSTGPDPYTGSSARDSAPATATPTASPSASATGSNVTQGVDGSAPGLYGGTRKTASCDVEKQIKSLTAQPDRNKAFASVQNIEPSAVPAYLRSLTPVQLRLDTRVTNHGYRDGSPTSYQAVLQAGTAVLVDDRGVPRVRCACGNPLLPPVALKGTPKQTGKPWPGYRASNVVVVEPAPRPVNKFVMFDPRSDGWFSREAGDTGGGDKKTDPPAHASAKPCPPGSDKDACPSASSSSRPPSSKAPSAPATRPGEPSSEPPAPPPSSQEPPPATQEPPASEEPPNSESAPEPVAPQTADSPAPPAPPASGDGTADGSA